MQDDRFKPLTIALLAVVLAIAGGSRLPRVANGVQPKKPGNRMQVGELYRQLPLHFEANQGQSNPSVKFLSRGSGYGMFLTPTEVVLVLSKQPEAAVIRMQLRGANPAPEVKGIDELPGKVHYFVGKDPNVWRTNVPTYAKVRYESVYPGIDSVYYGTGRQLEYDFVIAPGADPGVIRLGFEGSERLSIDANGDLLVQAGGAEDLRLHKPVAYQDLMGSRTSVPTEYVLLDGGNVAFNIGGYDARERLVIDPVLSYSTYLGGNDYDQVDGIAVDDDGNMYLTGGTYSGNFPTANALQPAIGAAGALDAFVAKLNPTGTTLLYSTYLGGASAEYGESIAIDSSGNAYITGYTRSSNFPVSNAVDPSLNGMLDAFLTKLNSNGSALIYSTFLGGDANEFGKSIAVDAAGNAYITGNTTSTNFPTVNALQASSGGGQDAIVAKLNAAGSAYDYATYLGGSSDDNGEGIAIDGSGNAYIIGNTASGNFPTATPHQGTYGGGAHDAIVSKVNATGSALTFSTYLGGSFNDIGFGITVDGSNNVYVTGSTNSFNFPTVSPRQGSVAGFIDAFVSKYNASGTLVYSTYHGGNVDDGGLAIAVDGFGNIYVVGGTKSTNFPNVNATQLSFGGIADTFVSKFNPSGSSLLFSTFLGGNDEDGSRDMVLKSGYIYLVGVTASLNFPTVNPLQPSSGGGLSDGFVTKISDPAPKKVRGQIISQ